MKKNIDILIVNNAPAFYKINLYNELAKKCKIHVVFLALTNQVVIANTLKDDIHFSYEIISPCQIEFRNKLKSFMKLYKIIKQYAFKKIIFGGYDSFECMFLPYFTISSKNCIQFESSIRESKVRGLVGFIKKIILKRYSIALTSGNLQSMVFKELNFDGDLIETFGVGIFNKVKFENTKTAKPKLEISYVFVGRLIPLKNLEFLIKVFNKLSKKLTIVGTGYLESELKSIAGENISFKGFVSNDQIYKIYLENDVFILPSLSEPWGLVVEEAVYFNLPVLISEAVGCQDEMVFRPNTGVSFSPNDENSLISAIDKIEDDFSFYKDNCQSFNFEQRDLRQVESYLKILQ